MQGLTLIRNKNWRGGAALRQRDGNRAGLVRDGSGCRYKILIMAEKRATRAAQRGKQHDDNTRAAVIAALLAGQGVDETAKEYKLPKSTVSTWKKTAQDKFDQLRTKKGESFDELIFGYLRASVTSLAIQAEHFGDKGWLQKQPASELAVLHGVQTDKAILLLSALERGGDGDAG